MQPERSDIRSHMRCVSQPNWSRRLSVHLGARKIFKEDFIGVIVVNKEKYIGFNVKINAKLSRVIKEYKVYKGDKVFKFMRERGVYPYVYFGSQ